jgi:hypothetical protein
VFTSEKNGTRKTAAPFCLLAPRQRKTHAHIPSFGFNRTLATKRFRNGFTRNPLGHQRLSLKANLAEQKAARLADNLAQDHKGSVAVPRADPGTSPATCDPTPQSIGEAIHSAGEPLDPAVRSEMERHF